MRAAASTLHPAYPPTSYCGRPTGLSALLTGLIRRLRRFCYRRRAEEK
jgi:hypothetical protein